MAARKRLVLDAGGVLFDERFRSFLCELAADNDVSPDEIRALYNGGLRQRLWRGECTVDEFWTELGEALGTHLDRAVTEAQLTERLQPLAALTRLQGWASKAEIWILSNHRHEWLRPLLKAHAGDVPFTRLLISSEIGEMKPDEGIYAEVLDGAEDVLFVDDKQENLDAAARLGLPTLLADKECRWYGVVDAWLAV
jgi:putative hydrolase of the HAD superfamily